MGIKGAMKILNAKYFIWWKTQEGAISMGNGTFDEWMELLEKEIYDEDTEITMPFDLDIKVITAFEKYMEHEGFIWAGLNGHRWVYPEQMEEIYNIWSGMGHQLEMKFWRDV